MNTLQIQNLKKLLLFCLILFSTLSVEAQSRYSTFANSIVQFAKPFRVLHNEVDKNGNGTIEYTNPQNQILRFRLYNHKPQIMHGGIAYQLFYYNKNYLQRIDTYDENGKLAGERESQNEAVIIFIIEKPNAYLLKKKILDDAEGNINMKDDSNEKIIRTRFLDADHRPINEEKPFYISSKNYWDYNIRMYWP